MDLLIRYRDGEDELSERRISPIERAGTDSIVAFCHLRQDERTFRLSRIVSAVNAKTGEIVRDLHQVLGIPEPEPEIDKQAKSQIAPSRSLEEAKLQRNSDRRVLYKPFRLAVIADHARSRLFELFSNACFNCGSNSELVIDHHVPQSAGGRLVPGNLVILCRRCNGIKLDQLPTTFYSAKRLQELQPLLNAQASLFSFKFDWRAWELDREAYLRSLGISPDLVRQVLDDENHPIFVGREQEGESNDQHAAIICLAMPDSCTEPLAKD